MLKVLTNSRNVCAHNERLFTHRCPKHDIPDFLLHQKLQIPKTENQYIYGKRDYFAVVMAFRYLISHEEFLEYKRSLTKLLNTLTQNNPGISISKLLDVMGMPLNWSKITSYKK